VSGLAEPVRVVRGAPGPEELAAVLVVLLAGGRGRAPASGRAAAAMAAWPRESGERHFGGAGSAPPARRR